MTFFSDRQLKPRRIVVDTTRINSTSPEVQKRLDRIQDNYHQLDLILAQVEAKIQADERLKAMNDDAQPDGEAELIVKKKRKWRARKPRTAKLASGRTRSSSPKKPR